MRDSAFARPSVLQAGHGEAAPSAHQREPRAAQDPYPGRPQERRKPGAGARGPGAGPRVWGTAGYSAHRTCPQSSRHSKLEKADILEMTVRHLQGLRRVQVTAALSADPAVLGKYRAGFNECLAEVSRFLASCEGVPVDVRSRLLGHLASCLGQLASSRRPAPPTPAAEAPASEVFTGCPLLPAFDGPLPLLRPGAVFALLPAFSGSGPTAVPGLTGAPPAVPRPGPQGQAAPWRPWLR
ncbi:transcription factor HES-4 isoform X1 [Trichechus manatus latirostris]|uniref:Transcription factor HES-4 isoform X1 n=1 Tax=Trichechus manatus latirostris TaxID=127582 RepID=A0A2Y9RJG4_TRIMA|nr:transcription factor HES-4 isoform X1 [Trichechus manatus latirostris]